MEEDESFQAVYVPTNDNTANFLTKPLTPIKTKQAISKVFLKAF
jgi:hypothetical protein